MSNQTHSEDRTVPLDFFKHLHANPTALAVFTKLPANEKKSYVRFVEEVSDGSARKERIDEVIVRLMLAAT